jgi:hypothetical protein
MKEVRTLLREQQRVLTDIQVKLAAIDGRMIGLEAKLNAIPTTWTLLGIIFTTWALGSGILIFAMNFVRP